MSCALLKTRFFCLIVEFTKATQLELCRQMLKDSFHIRYLPISRPTDTRPFAPALLNSNCCPQGFSVPLPGATRLRAYQEHFRGK